VRVLKGPGPTAGAPSDRDERIKRFSDLRRSEFNRLDTAGIAYLDHTASGLYPESLIRGHGDRLRMEILGNPHSENGPSSESTRLIERTRLDVLEFFDADPDEWTVIFTANASAAVKLVGEAFPFDDASRLLLFADNHNSVNGLREFARTGGAAIEYLPLDDELRVLWRTPDTATAPSLLAFPAQSNFSGVQHPLEICEQARAAGYAVLVDAAAFVPTNRLTLSRVAADFVCVSFYKMFGFPTGVGALVARRDALGMLRRPWFSGGTVEWVTVETGERRMLPCAEAFEDGTPNFLGIAAVSAGLAFLSTLGMDDVHAHVTDLTVRLLESFAAVETALGRPLVRVHGPEGIERRGATVAFNLLDDSGVTLPYEEVERAASEAGIAVRGGCFCNPGASEYAFGVDAKLALRCLQGLPEGEFHPRRLGECLDGAPVGALRASVGIGSNASDVDRLVDFLADYAGRAQETRATASVGVQ
jgi:selenocysteine lyase/cysteine desulfurase